MRAAPVNELPQHGRRLVREQLLQLLFVAVSFLDRLVLTSAMNRQWGTAAFEDWSTCSAIAGLLCLFEFGFNMYFNNKLTIEIEQKGPPALQAQLGIANTIFVSCTLVCIGTCVALLIVVGPTAGHATTRLEMTFAMAMLAFAVVCRIPMLGIYSLYRAHRKFGRFAAIMSLAELARIGVLLAVVAIGGGVAIAATATGLCAFVLLVLIPMVDAHRQFAVRKIAFALPKRSQLRDLFAKSSAFFAQTLPITILMHAPLLYLAREVRDVGPVAVFVLLRTLTSLPRTLMQSLGVVAGQECGRLLAAGDDASAFRVVEQFSRAFAAMSGVTAGLIIGLGRDIMLAWMGDAAIFRLDYIVIASLPMILAGASVLYHNVLIASDAPYFGATARLMQLLISVTVVLAAPIDDPVARVFVALTAGEVIGFSLVACVATSRLISRVGWTFHATSVATTLLAAAGALAACQCTLLLMPSNTLSGALARIVFAGALATLPLYWIGLTAQMRRKVVDRAQAAVRRQHGAPA